MSLCGINSIISNFSSSKNTLKISVRAENKQQALLQAKAALAKGNYTIEGSLSMPGNPYLIAGLNTELKDLGFK